MLYTRCPQCNTLFRVSGAQLRIALGYVRCGACKEIFNGLQTLGDTPDECATEPAANTAGTSHEQPAVTEQTADLAPQGQLGLEGFPGLALEQGARPSTERDTHTLPFDVPDGLPDLEPTAFAAVDQKRDRRWAVWGSLGVVFLVALASLQLAWFERYQLVTSTEGRLILEFICRMARCEVPYRRDLDKFRILQRDLSSLSETPGALLFRLDFVNDAEFPQPYPDIQIGLYTGEDVLAASRTFTPKEYFSDDQTAPPLLAPQTPVRIQLALADPGQRMTGFRLDFR